MPKPAPTRAPAKLEPPRPSAAPTRAPAQMEPPRPSAAPATTVNPPTIPQPPQTTLDQFFHKMLDPDQDERERLLDWIATERAQEEQATIEAAIARMNQEALQEQAMVQASGKRPSRWSDVPGPYGPMVQAHPTAAPTEQGLKLEQSELMIQRCLTTEAQQAGALVAAQAHLQVNNEELQRQRALAHRALSEYAEQACQAQQQQAAASANDRQIMQDLADMKAKEMREELERFESRVDKKVLTYRLESELSEDLAKNEARAQEKTKELLEDNKRILRAAQEQRTRDLAEARM